MRISDWSSDVCSSDLAHAFDRMVKQEFGLCGFVIKILYRNHIQVIIEIHMILVLQIAQWGHFTIPENVFPSALGCIALQKTISIYGWDRSEEHTSELKSLMRKAYAVFCLIKKNT